MSSQNNCQERLTLAVHALDLIFFTTDLQSWSDLSLYLVVGGSEVPGR